MDIPCVCGMRARIQDSQVPSLWVNSPVVLCLPIENTLLLGLAMTFEGWICTLCQYV